MTIQLTFSSNIVVICIVVSLILSSNWLSSLLKLHKSLRGDHTDCLKSVGIKWLAIGSHFEVTHDLYPIFEMQLSFGPEIP